MKSIKNNSFSRLFLPTLLSILLVGCSTSKSLASRDKNIDKNSIKTYINTNIDKNSIKAYINTNIGKNSNSINNKVNKQSDIKNIEKDKNKKQADKKEITVSKDKNKNAKKTKKPVKIVSLANPFTKKVEVTQEKNKKSVKKGKIIVKNAQELEQAAKDGYTHIVVDGNITRNVVVEYKKTDALIIQINSKYSKSLKKITINATNAKSITLTDNGIGMSGVVLDELNINAPKTHVDNYFAVDNVMIDEVAKNTFNSLDSVRKIHIKGTGKISLSKELMNRSDFVRPDIYVSTQREVILVGHFDELIADGGIDVEFLEIDNKPTTVEKITTKNQNVTDKLKGTAQINHLETKNITSISKNIHINEIYINDTRENKEKYIINLSGESLVDKIVFLNDIDDNKKSKENKYSKNDVISSQKTTKKERSNRKNKDVDDSNNDVKPNTPTIPDNEEPSDGQDRSVPDNEEQSDGQDRSVPHDEEPSDGQDRSVPHDEEQSDGQDRSVPHNEEPSDIPNTPTIPDNEEPSNGKDRCICYLVVEY